MPHRSSRRSISRTNMRAAQAMRQIPAGPQQPNFDPALREANGVPAQGPDTQHRSKSVLHCKGENRPIAACTRIFQRQPPQSPHACSGLASLDASASLGHYVNVASLVPEQRRNRRTSRESGDERLRRIAVLLGKQPGGSDRGVDYDHAPRAPSRLHARTSSRVTDFARARAARASATTATRSRYGSAWRRARCRGQR